MALVTLGMAVATSQVPGKPSKLYADTKIIPFVATDALNFKKQDAYALVRKHRRPFGYKTDKANVSMTYVGGGHIHKISFINLQWA